MLLAEYDYETDIAVQRAEEREIAFTQGITQGISQGIAQGRSEGIAQGSYQTKLETAKLMKQANCEISFIEKMTGLSQTEVEAIK